MATHSSVPAQRLPINRGDWWSIASQSRTPLRQLNMHTRTAAVNELPPLPSRACSSLGEKQINSYFISLHFCPFTPLSVLS